MDELDEPADEPDEPAADGARMRWLARGTVAFTILLVAALVVPQFFGSATRTVGEPTPTGPTAPSSDSSRRVGTGDPFDSGPLVVRPNDRVVAAPMLFEDAARGDGIRFCIGTMTAQRPPACTGKATTGITWQQVRATGVEVATDGALTWADVVVSGTFDGATFAVDEVYGTVDQAPWQPYADQGNGLNFEALCSPSRQQVEKGSATAAQAAAEALPDYQFTFVNGVTLNVIVTEDVVRAREQIEKVYLGPLCVGRAQGLTFHQLSTAQRAVVTQLAAEGVTGAGIRPETQGAALEVHVTMLTQDLRDRIIAVVGPEVAQWLIIKADVMPVI